LNGRKIKKKKSWGRQHPPSPPPPPPPSHTHTFEKNRPAINKPQEVGGVTVILA